jgi:cell pole-organizing protein PopZ
MKQTSAASAKPQEPSMEEILASIRRIIADDADGGKTPEPPRPAARDVPAAQPVAAPPPEPETDEDDDVLDLAEIAPVARDVPAARDASAARDAAASRPAPPTLDLDHEDVSFSDGAALDFDALGVDEEPEPQPAPPPPRPRGAFSRPEPPRPEPARAEPPRESAAERLLSGQADAHVSRAFNMLATTVLTNNARTLEDLVKDMLKPLLKAWLDDNLPPLVERLVRAEIERVARGGS